jgi:DNA-binding LacI/PurR family transcriptional regulator
MAVTSRGTAPATGAHAPRMSDVAQVAGVSHQTVSRVLNDHPAVRPETRDRVLVAISTLGYRRNSAARALATKRSATIGVISFDTTLFGPASTLYGIEEAAHEAGYYVSVASNKTITRATVLDGVQRLAAQSVEGFIVIAPQREAFAAVAELPRDVPLVVVEGRSDSWAPVVSVDQFRGGRLAVEHLLARGARTVRHISGPDGWLEAEGREAGWRAVLDEAGIEAPRALRGDWTAASGYAAGQQLVVQLADQRTGYGAVAGVFVGNDQMALGMLRAFHEAGVRVPDDVLVAGFDDVPEAAFFTPPLTTVRQDFITLGRLCIELLLRRIDGDTAADVRSVVEPELIVRQSSGGPGGDAS